MTRSEALRFIEETDAKLYSCGEDFIAREKLDAINDLHNISEEEWDNANLEVIR